MTDPHDAQNNDNFNVSEAVEAHFISPAISISTVSDGRRVKASNHPQVYRQRAPVRGAKSSAAADSASGTQPDSLHYDLEHPTVDDHDTTTTQYLTGGSADQEIPASRNLVFGSFGSEPWVAPSRPYLDFAPQPVYEPTGELVDEQTPSFDHFDNSTLTGPFSTFVTDQETPQPASIASPGNTGVDPASVNVFVQPALPRSALKRKADSFERPEAGSSNSRKSFPPVGDVGLRRTVSFDRMSGAGPISPEDGSNSSDPLSGQIGAHSRNSAAQQRRTRQSAAPTPRAQLNLSSDTFQSSARPSRGTRPPSGHPPTILPPEKVFPIQIGSDLFRLSGASISSDAPSYFTQFFEEQIRQNEESGGVRTLYIDRDPGTFRDVARHLQGYHVKPLDGSHFVKLFADAQFYSLPRLIDQLFESEIFIQIGERHFQIPKDIFSEPGNSPNFFSLGFAVFFSTPGEVFPGLDRRGLLRPPSITPPYVPGRSADIFSELLHLLRGYSLRIRDESHRAELLRDCRYFHLRGLEQKIIAHEITYNAQRQKQEISLRLEDVKPSGVSYKQDDSTSERVMAAGWVYYARPFVDDTSYEMVVEIGGECTTLDLTDMRADFHNLAKARVASLLQVVANKMNLPTNAPLGLMMLSGGPSTQSASPGHTPLSEDRVKIRFEAATDIILDGEAFEVDWDSPQGDIMAQGPPIAPNESESEPDVMSEAASARGTSKIPAEQQKRPQTRRSAVGPSHGAGRQSLAVPPIQTSRLSTGPSAKKRKRQDNQDELGEWIIRTGQWRLRVQPNPVDTIRGGFEIVFIGVKIDAYSNEKARNARRAFLN